MNTFIGMDEAGYGPNLGPLLISATSWEIPDQLKSSDLWVALESVLTNTPARKDPRLHVADSKQVYSTTKGIQSLEKSVLVFLSISGHPINSFQSLWKSLTQDHYPKSSFPPWFHETDISLPVKNSEEDILSAIKKMNHCLDENGIHLKEIRSDMILAERFNDCLDQYGNKGIALTTLSLSLLKDIWDPSATNYIVADKHGGRNRYDEYLSEITDEMIFRVEESSQKSIYRIVQSNIRFQTKAESHLPVALASMVCKYLRELSMELFNQYWIQHQPELKPTKGYPQDARRFRSEIEKTQKKLGITDKILWRNK